MHATRSATALLVDDDPATRRANQERLEDEGYWVLLAPDETEALSRVRESAPNVIFVHLGVGGLGNLPFIQTLRSDDGCRHVPVVLMNDHHSVNVERRRLRAVNREGW
jgi:CheY-like chemotaxis protein